MLGEILSWEELHEKEYEPAKFLIDPYIPRQGIVLLYAKSSVGKSPLSWQMAKAVAEGTHFFGLPASQGKVLYIEVDTPEIVIVPRIRKLPPTPGVWWMFLQPMSVPQVPPDVLEALKEAQQYIKPDLVVLNTLRKLHDLDDKESRTPKLVYSFFQHLFPQAALLFVHHERKESTDPRASPVDGENFSGSRHWIDDAQVGIQLQKVGGGEAKENLRLYQWKSQVCEPLKPLPLLLSSDGSTLTSPLYEELLTTYEFLNSEEAEGMERREIDQRLATALGVSVRTAQRRRRTIEERKFPGSHHFLSKEGGEE